MVNIPLYDLTSVFAWIWNSLKWAVEWLQGHGVTIWLSEDLGLTCNFFVMGIAFCVLEIILALVPLFDDEYWLDRDLAEIDDALWGDD